MIKKLEVDAVMDETQNVEILRSETDLYCPFCGQHVMADSEPMVSPCLHTLFIATDDGFEYRSKKFSEAAGLDPDDDENSPDLGEDSYAGFLMKRGIPNSFCLVLYPPAPAGLGLYVGFLP